MSVTVGNPNPDPAAGAIAASAAIAFDVTITGGVFADLVILVYFQGTNLVEVAYDGTNFTPFYNGQSSQSAITNGFHFSLIRAGGWPGAPAFSVHAH